MSKSTISLWCRDVRLGAKQRRRLRQLLLNGADRARQRWNEKRRVLRAELLRRLAESARREIGTFSRRDRFIAGIMLYAGEGDKSQERVGISNADPRILHFALDWFCDFLSIDRSKFTVHLYLHAGRSERRAKAFWTDALEIHASQFRQSYRPQPRKSHKRNVHEFGVCAVRAHNKIVHRKIMAWIKEALNVHMSHIPG